MASCESEREREGSASATEESESREAHLPQLLRYFKHELSLCVLGVIALLGGIDSVCGRMKVSSACSALPPPPPNASRTDNHILVKLRLGVILRLDAHLVLAH